METKAELRTRFKALRDACPAAQRALGSQAICRHLAANADRGVGQTGGTSPVTVKFKLRS